MSNAVFKCLAEVQPEPVKWLWEGRIPLGKVTLLEGEPGVGKSTVALELAARVSRGAGMPFQKANTDHKPGNVVLYSGDDNLADTVRPRLDAAHADLSRIWSVDREIDQDDVAHLKPTLIILDPLSGYCLSCDQTPIEVMRKLGRLAKATGAAILTVQSVAEDMKDDWSPEFYGTPRSVLHLTPIGHGGRRLAVAKSNLRHIPDVHPLVYYFDDDHGEVRIVNWSDGR